MNSAKRGKIVAENRGNCQELLRCAVVGFYEAKKTNSERDKLYFKGLSEGMMKILREADLMDKEEIDSVIDEVAARFSGFQKKYSGFDLQDIDTPAFIRYGKDIRVER